MNSCRESPHWYPAWNHFHSTGWARMPVAIRVWWCSDPSYCDPIEIWMIWMELVHVALSGAACTHSVLGFCTALCCQISAREWSAPETRSFCIYNQVFSVFQRFERVI